MRTRSLKQPRTALLYAASASEEWRHSVPLWTRSSVPPGGRQRCGCSAIPSAVPRALQPRIMLPAPLQPQLFPLSVPQAQLGPVAPGRLRFIVIRSLKSLSQISWESQEEYLRQKQTTLKGTAGYRCSYPCEWKPRNTWNTPDSYDWPANATANTYLCFK